jgi:hypothetical protein
MAEFEHIPLLHKIAEHLEANNRLLEKLVERGERVEHRLECMERVLVRIERRLPCPTDATNVTGGKFTQIGEPPMLAIQPGNSPKFQVTPTFSGEPFTLDGTKAAVSTSDAVNAPAKLDLDTDPTGATFELDLTPDVVIGAGGEPIVVTWTYTNEDGDVATVTGTVTEEGIVDDVTGGTFAQVA